MTRRRLLVPIIATAAALVLAVGVAVGWLRLTGTPLIDEWACGAGEAPYLYPEGGSACAAPGSALPAGATWDPFGNRPLECHDRRGWTEVEPVAALPEPNPYAATECVRRGEPIPSGWRPVE